ncbi:hypothetical protein V6N13_081942 [Hibiscus sabdariffa]
MGRMGSPQADAQSTLVPKHTETTRAGFHDRGNDVSTGVSKARAWAATTIRVGPCPEPVGRPALAVPSRQFQALFGSLLNVLFIFPSRQVAQSQRDRASTRPKPRVVGRPRVMNTPTDWAWPGPNLPSDA